MMRVLEEKMDGEMMRMRRSSEMPNSWKRKAKNKGASNLSVNTKERLIRKQSRSRSPRRATATTTTPRARERVLVESKSGEESLPPGWEECKDNYGRIFYHHVQTDRSCWRVPKIVRLPRSFRGAAIDAKLFVTSRGDRTKTETVVTLTSEEDSCTLFTAIYNQELEDVLHGRSLEERMQLKIPTLAQCHKVCKKRKLDEQEYVAFIANALRGTDMNSQEITVRTPGRRRTADTPRSEPARHRKTPRRKTTPDLTRIGDETVRNFKLRRETQLRHAKETKTGYHSHFGRLASKEDDSRSQFQPEEKATDENETIEQLDVDCEEEDDGLGLDTKDSARALAEFLVYSASPATPSPLEKLRQSELAREALLKQVEASQRLIQRMEQEKARIVSELEERIEMAESRAEIAEKLIDDIRNQDETLEISGGGFSDHHVAQVKRRQSELITSIEEAQRGRKISIEKQKIAETLLVESQAEISKLRNQLEENQKSNRRTRLDLDAVQCELEQCKADIERAETAKADLEQELLHAHKKHQLELTAERIERQALDERVRELDQLLKDLEADLSSDKKVDDDDEDPLSKGGEKKQDENNDEGTSLLEHSTATTTTLERQSSASTIVGDGDASEEGEHQGSKDSVVPVAKLNVQENRYQKRLEQMVERLAYVESVAHERLLRLGRNLERIHSLELGLREAQREREESILDATHARTELLRAKEELQGLKQERSSNVDHYALIKKEQDLHISDLKAELATATEHLRKGHEALEAAKNRDTELHGKIKELQGEVAERERMHACAISKVSELQIQLTKAHTNKSEAIERIRKELWGEFEERRKKLELEHLNQVQKIQGKHTETITKAIARVRMENEGLLKKQRQVLLEETDSVREELNRKLEASARERNALETNLEQKQQLLEDQRKDLENSRNETTQCIKLSALRTFQRAVQLHETRLKHAYLVKWYKSTQSDRAEEVVEVYGAAMDRTNGSCKLAMTLSRISMRKVVQAFLRLKRNAFQGRLMQHQVAQLKRQDLRANGIRPEQLIRGIKHLVPSLNRKQVEDFVNSLRTDRNGNVSKTELFQALNSPRKHTDMSKHILWSKLESELVSHEINLDANSSTGVGIGRSLEPGKDWMILASVSLTRLGCMVDQKQNSLRARGFRKWLFASKMCEKVECMAEKEFLQHMEKQALQQEVKALHAQLAASKAEAWRFKRKLMTNFDA